MKSKLKYLIPAVTAVYVLLLCDAARAQTDPSNTATGIGALASITTGSGNTADGYQALQLNTTGADNTATGNFALLYNTTGDFNLAIGGYALFSNTTGYYNAASGSYALEFNTTGSYNTATGGYSLYQNGAGNENQADGFEALFSNKTGSENTAVGNYALDSNTTGQSNIAVGYEAGSNLTTGDRNIDIGNHGFPDDARTIRLGTQGRHEKTYIAGIFGETAACGVPVYVDSKGRLGTLTSSAKFKQNIHDMGNVSDALMSLRPVTFQYKSDIDPTGTPQFGLIAEEVEKVSPDLVVHDAGHQIYTVRYEAVNAMLLNEFQKQHETIAEQEKTIAEQQKFADEQVKINADQQKLLQSLAARLAQLEQEEARGK